MSGTRLFSTAVTTTVVTEDGKTTTTTTTDGDGEGFAIGVWVVVFVIWVITWASNWRNAGAGTTLALPDIPAGVAGLLAALPIGKAVAALRKR